MFLSEPPRTQFDLRFRLWDIPVRIHPFFWLAALIMFGIGGNLQGRDAPMLLGIWVSVVFFSILIHELGHALVMKLYGDRPSIVLYHFGGLAIPGGEGGGGFYDSSWRPQARLGPIEQIQISIAGPMAGFVLALAALIVARFSGVNVSIDFAGYIPYPAIDGLYERVGLRNLLWWLLLLNIFWGLMNLLPVFPLDGGQISRELFKMSGSYDWMRKSLYLSMFVGIGAAVFGFAMLGSLWIAFLFGSLAFSNWQILQQMQRF